MRYSKTLRCLMALALPAVLLMGCSSPPGIAVNEGQTVVMDSSVLTAGILADTPSLSTASGQMMAASLLSNSQTTPVTVHYRFYWYNAQGLDIRPFEEPREVVVAPGAEVKIYSLNGNLDAKRARLYLFL
ncbi:Predicted periplasmic lipoprotein [Serratia entomophila]|uniref:YcfL family protein n=1 Tax=Serratia entomophila TaxID=42906 RepID=UPI00217935E1|nr:YcfL family protein [Serratia entomophila]CAI0725113.1 Predicted periplasmic lipoprotein [Serratia entomophila]CAI0735301.1 Predicted periplasmic lipoprotein [Serratia entomophila]CAI1803095.1 Predicted periplasmic lipoprotein [Serratia entomophila]CAI2060733.1 Predicted periplasmic lipoprotein [Serratia entomophila]CAI2926849.1 Predicted periplasmic lipoprotein [Serratia entomophila]